MLFLQLMGEFLAELGYLGRYHRCAITLERITLEIFLMIILGRVEGHGRNDFGHDFVVPDLLGLERGDGLESRLPLGIGMVKHRRAVLRAGIVTLPIQRSRIVNGKKYPENFLV